MASSSGTPLKSIYEKPKLTTLRVGPEMLKLTRSHHMGCMKKMFFQYYVPLEGNLPNYEWVTHLDEKVKLQLRLHLSWVRGANVCGWNDREIGKTIVQKFKSMGLLPFLKYINKNKKQVPVRVIVI